MQFYKVEGMIENAAGNDKVRGEFIKKLAVRGNGFNERLCKESFCFISDSFDGMMILGIITEHPANVQDILSSYLKHMGIMLKDFELSEITISGLDNLLSTASRKQYICDEDEIKEKYGLSGLDNGLCICYSEDIIEDCSKKDLFESVQKTPVHETLLPELERIYAGTASKEVYGHPVHYMFELDNAETRAEAYKMLLRALYANKRLKSRRCCCLPFLPDGLFSPEACRRLYEVCTGGAVLLHYKESKILERMKFTKNRSSLEETVEELCKIIKRYRNQVLTMIYLPHRGEKIRELFRQHLGNMSFVEIREELVSDERASSYLKALAKKNHIEADPELLSCIRPGKGYLTSELYTMYDEWCSHKLQTTVYPQYKDISVVGKEAVRSAPKGSAYSELQEMIGLDEAKALIQKALNYYKIQKLYEDKGLKRERPAMHMVFKGNPGTAKTTVARLFAEIMKDNGLLSKGQLIEVGRSDLVGEYVGWTANIVKKKFKEASGGVLFIDEAYSLVDGSESYGDEAINTIVQEMENHRDDVVVIFAGYPDKMETFIRKNPGLRSRIAFHVPFEDYSTSELCRIAHLMAKRTDMAFDEGAAEKLESIFEEARKQKDFGNGRFVRNIMEQAKMNQASRLVEMDFEDITFDVISTIQAVDLAGLEPNTKPEQKTGFVW